MNGKVHDCIRIRKPGAAAKPKVMKPEPDPDMNDDLPEFA
jgi:hypothetical protein